MALSILLPFSSLSNLQTSRSKVLFRYSASELSICRHGHHASWKCFLKSYDLTYGATIVGYGRSLFVTSRENMHKLLSYKNEEAPVLEGRSIEEVYDTLTHHILTVASMEEYNSKYIVGLAGPPGAGKSTLASEVVHRLNTTWSKENANVCSPSQPDAIAAVLPMDGFHIYRSQLDAMENPEEAHARRGAPWTFNPDLLLKCLQTLRNKGSVYAPSFDHAVGDPVEEDVFISSQHKVIIVEGNYLLLEERVWKELSFLFDEKWFLDIDVDIAMERLLRRHISTGKEPGVAKWRIEYNDRPNAELIMESKKNADLIIRSVDCDLFTR